MNKWFGIGRLAQDPEVRYTQSGKAVASFNLAVNRYGQFSICAKCGNRFIKNMKSKIYCSDRCRAAAKEKRIR